MLASRRGRIILARAASADRQEVTVQEGSKATRRAVLRQGLFAIGAVAGLAGLTGLAEKARSGAIQQPRPYSASTLRLYGSDWHLAAPGLRRGDPPRRGDQVSVSGTLRFAPGEEEVGTFFSSVVHLDGPSAHGPYATAQLETHTFQLPDGTLVGIGTATGEGPNVFSIVGGTGRFLGVTGSYTARQSPLETGGDGTAEFIVTFNKGR
jgi:hypothetical protein